MKLEDLLGKKAIRTKPAIYPVPPSGKDIEDGSFMEQYVSVRRIKIGRIFIVTQQGSDHDLIVGGPFDDDNWEEYKE